MMGPVQIGAMIMGDVVYVAALFSMIWRLLRNKQLNDFRDVLLEYIIMTMSLLFAMMPVLKWTQIAPNDAFRLSIEMLCVLIFLVLPSGWALFIVRRRRRTQNPR